MLFNKFGTFAERFRSMTDDEIAVFLFRFCEACKDCEMCPLSRTCPMGSAVYVFKHWLQVDPGDRPEKIWDKWSDDDVCNLSH